MTSYALQLSDDEVQRYREMAAAAVAAERTLWEAAGITSGAAIADVGCRPGAVSVLLAEAVGSEGRVWAVDADPQALKVAAALAARAGFSHVETVVGDAAATGLPAASLDGAMLRHVLAHNGGREQAIVDHLAGLQYKVEDLAGHRWSFSQTIADVAPKEWDGTARNDGP